MFVELMPMLAGRTVLITVARENDKTVRVCVIPKKVKEDDNPALTTPLSYTGTTGGTRHGTGKTLGELRRVSHPIGQYAGPGQS